MSRMAKSCCLTPRSRRAAQILVDAGAVTLGDLKLNFDLADTIVDGALLGRPALRQVEAVQFHLAQTEIRRFGRFPFLMLKATDLALQGFLLRRGRGPDLFLDSGASTTVSLVA
jgi:hypothetical protein